MNHFVTFFSGFELRGHEWVRFTVDLSYLGEVTQMTPDVCVWISKWDEMSGSGVTVEACKEREKLIS